MQEHVSQEPAQKSMESESLEGASMSPPAFSLTAASAHSQSPASPPAQMKMVSQLKEGDNYEKGNRPNPSSSNGSTYEIQSSQGSVMIVGDSVDFNLKQIQAAIQSTDSVLEVNWQVLNHGVDLVDLGTRSGFEMGTINATIPGIHTIQAIITLNGNPLETVSFSQVVESGDTSYENVKGVTPSPMTSIAEFIAIVERVEAAYSGYAWQDIASKIRKQYYPFPDNSKKGRAKAAFTWNDLVDEQQHISPLKSPPCTKEDIAALRRSDPSVQGIDVGHVLTGLDSMNFPETAGLFDLYSMAGPAAATWSGDVGSALVDWAEKYGRSDPSGSKRVTSYNDKASTDDILGDLDGINIAMMPSLGPDANLSTRLKTYYQSKTPESSNKRYHRFCEVSGFTLVGGKISAKSREYIKSQIWQFAKAFNLPNSAKETGKEVGKTLLESVTHIPLPSSGPSTAQLMEPNLDWFTDHFIQEVEAGLASE